MEAIKSSIAFFLVEHMSVIENYKELDEQLENRNSVRGCIEFAFKIINSFKRKAYIIIDEYDHFANDLIAQGTNLSVEQYKQLIWANGVVRDFYETLKDNAETVIEKIFITGITPIMLDDVTSGFNISSNLSIDRQYNEILGFTEAEVENRLYNSSMVNYYFLQILKNGERIEYMIDDNLRTDYGRIKMLLDKPESVEYLENIIEHEKVSEQIVPRFSIDKIHEQRNFLSLLYYLGLVTIDRDDNTGEALLRIPNYMIKTMYWEYMENLIMERSSKIREATPTCTCNAGASCIRKC